MQSFFKKQKDIREEHKIKKTIKIKNTGKQLSLYMTASPTE
jgi:hypothetical protein